MPLLDKTARESERDYMQRSKRWSLAGLGKTAGELKISIDDEWLAWEGIFSVSPFTGIFCQQTGVT